MDLSPEFWKEEDMIWRESCVCEAQKELMQGANVFGGLVEAVNVLTEVSNKIKVY